MNGNLRFEDKIVAITGASSGIGRASALAFAREGATTVLASRSEEKLERVADEIRSFNPRVLVIPTDVSVREQVQHLVDRTVREFGRIDILFNNAGNAYVGRIDEEPFADDLNKMLGVSFCGTLYGTQAVLPIMKRQGAGHIVNMSSMVGRKAFPHFRRLLDHHARDQRLLRRPAARAAWHRDRCNHGISGLDSDRDAR
jgi:NADP-dependent 3-hydroxy acid dehydrogenase YdfG